MPKPPEIPPDQLQMIQPVLDALLTDLHRHTSNLPASDDPATDYVIESEVHP